MSPSSSQSAEYSRVSDKESDFESEDDFYNSEAAETMQRKRRGRILKFLKWSFWVVQVLLLGANVYGFTELRKTIHSDSAMSELNLQKRWK